ncbi:MAG: GTP cyclohydrolase II, partial [Candidatus Micrarchaeota archaeon]
GSLRCDCKEQLETAARRIGKETGIIVYLDQEGRDIGLGNKIRAYDLQDRGEDTVEANRLLGFPVDGRNYDPAVEILRHFKISSVKLLTNNPDKVAAVSAAGITVVQLKGASTTTEHNLGYLSTKLERMGHLGIMEMECIGNMRKANERPRESMTQRKENIKRAFSPRITT